MKKTYKIIIIITLYLMPWLVNVLLVGACFKLTHIPGADFMLALGLIGLCVDVSAFFLVRSR